MQLLKNLFKVCWKWKNADIKKSQWGQIDPPAILGLKILGINKIDVGYYLLSMLRVYFAKAISNWNLFIHLDHQIFICSKRNNITTEFEYFFQNLVNNISHIPEVQLWQVKTKLRDSCEINSRIKIPYKHRKTIEIYEKGIMLLF